MWSSLGCFISNSITNTHLGHTRLTNKWYLVKHTNTLLLETLQSTFVNYNHALDQICKHYTVYIYITSDRRVYKTHLRGTEPNPWLLRCNVMLERLMQVHKWVNRQSCYELTQQQKFKLSSRISFVSPELLVDLGVDSLGLLRLFTHATGHHGLQSHHRNVWRSQPRSDTLLPASFSQTSRTRQSAGMDSGECRLKSQRSRPLLLKSLWTPVVGLGDGRALGCFCTETKVLKGKTGMPSGYTGWINTELPKHSPGVLAQTDLSDQTRPNAGWDWRPAVYESLSPN